MVKVLTGKGPRGGRVKVPASATVSLVTATGRMVGLKADRARRYLASGTGTYALYNGKAVTF
jgi:hypothetical protein